MSIDITPEIAEMVQTILRTGNYESEADVLCEALNLLKKRDRPRIDINQGLAELESGHPIGGGEVFAELEAKAAQLANAKQ